MPKPEKTNASEGLAKTAVDALAEAWASLDGKLDKYLLDRDTEGGAPAGWFVNDETPWGYYDGYQSDASELLKRLAIRQYGLKLIASEDGTF